MKQRQEVLSQLLINHFGQGILPGNSINPDRLLRVGLMNEVERTYRKLGGVLPKPPLRFGPWDIVLKDFIAELDEEQHFNRYRALTLESFVYHEFRGFDLIEYTRYCSKYELGCLKKSTWGKYWTSPSSEYQFGPPGPRGDLSGNGSPRWKQRAFYDYLRDVYAMISGIPIIRISVYDKVNINHQLKIVDNILSNNNSADLNEIVKFIERKSILQ